jgi:TrkA-N domain/RyR domain
MANDSPDLNRSRLSRRILGVLALWVLLVFALGWWGLRTSAVEAPLPSALPPAPSALPPTLHPRLEKLYEVLKLFAIHGEMPSDSRYWHAARLLAALGELVAVLLALLALGHWLYDRYGFHLCTFWGNHAVVCGLGNKGLELARDLRSQGKRVLVIERDTENPLVSACDDLGVAILFGDATKPESLAKAKLHAAQTLVATCGHDGTNIEIIERANRLLSKRKKLRSNPLPCFPHIVDLELRSQFRWRNPQACGSARLDVRPFNVYENAARMLWQDHYFDPGEPITQEHDARHVHLIVLGFGPVGQSVAVEAVHLAHFPNRKKLRLTVIDHGVKPLIQRFLFRYPAFEQLCELEHVDCEVEDLGVMQQLKHWCESNHSIVNIVVCFGDDSHNAAFGLRLAKLLRCTAPQIFEHTASGSSVAQRCVSPQIFVHTASDTGVAQWVDRLSAQETSLPALFTFGKLSKACSAGVVIDERLNHFAKHIHEAFCQRASDWQHRGLDEDSMKSWEDLDPDYQESNRRQAEHMGHKLRAINCYLHPQDASSLAISDAAAFHQDVLLDSFELWEIERLAEMEHRRWIAERSLAGWRYGSAKNPQRWENPNLQPWKELSEQIKDYDLKAVEDIPALLNPPPSDHPDGQRVVWLIRRNFQASRQPNALRAGA